MKVLRHSLSVLLVLFAIIPTWSIDENHPLKQHLRSLHKRAGSETLRQAPQTPEQVRAIKDLRKQQWQEYDAHVRRTTQTSDVPQRQDIARTVDKWKIYGAQVDVSGTSEDEM